MNFFGKSDVSLSGGKSVAALPLSWLGDYYLVSILYFHQLPHFRRVPRDQSDEKRKKPFLITL